MGCCAPLNNAKKLNKIGVETVSVSLNLEIKPFSPIKIHRIVTEAIRNDIQSSNNSQSHNIIQSPNDSIKFDLGILRKHEKKKRNILSNIDTNRKTDKDEFSPDYSDIRKAILKRTFTKKNKDNSEILITSDDKISPRDEKQILDSFVDNIQKFDDKSVNQINRNIQKKCSIVANINKKSESNSSLTIKSVTLSSSKITYNNSNLSFEGKLSEKKLNSTTNNENREKDQFINTDIPKYTNSQRVLSNSDRDTAFFNTSPNHFDTESYATFNIKNSKKTSGQEIIENLTQKQRMNLNLKSSQNLSSFGNEALSFNKEHKSSEFQQENLENHLLSIHRTSFRSEHQESFIGKIDKINESSEDELINNMYDFNETIERKKSDIELNNYTSFSNRLIHSNNESRSSSGKFYAFSKRKSLDSGNTTDRYLENLHRQNSNRKRSSFATQKIKNGNYYKQNTESKDSNSSINLILEKRPSERRFSGFKIENAEKKINHGSEEEKSPLRSKSSSQTPKKVPDELKIQLRTIPKKKGTIAIQNLNQGTKQKLRKASTKVNLIKKAQEQTKKYVNNSEVCRKNNENKETEILLNKVNDISPLLTDAGNLNVRTIRGQQQLSSSQKLIKYITSESHIKTLEDQLNQKLEKNDTIINSKTKANSILNLQKDQDLKLKRYESENVIITKKYNNIPNYKEMNSNSNTKSSDNLCHKNFNKIKNIENISGLVNLRNKFKNQFSSVKSIHSQKLPRSTSLSNSPLGFSLSKFLKLFFYL